MTLTIPSSGHSWIKSRRDLRAVTVALGRENSEHSSLGSSESHSIRLTKASGRCGQRLSPFGLRLGLHSLDLRGLHFLLSLLPRLVNWLGGAANLDNGDCWSAAVALRLRFLLCSFFDHLTEKTLVSTSDIFRKKLRAVQVVHSMAIL